MLTINPNDKMIRTFSLITLKRSLILVTCMYERI